MLVFVTGGNGFIGSVVVRKLIEQGHSVRCLLRSTSDTRRLDGLRYERVVGDVRDAKSLPGGVRGCDGAVHLAACRRGRTSTRRFCIRSFSIQHETCWRQFVPRVGRGP
jgi:nucleoside-diphosphate-sugar epimerase